MNDSTRRSANQTVAALFGGIYLLVGLLGFAVSTDHGFTDTQSDKLLGIFEVNSLHNVVHLAIGLTLLGASRRLGSARSANTGIGATYLAVGLLGLFALGEDWNILALNGADNALHLASAALLLAVGVGADKAMTTDSAYPADASTTTGTRRRTTL